MKKNLLKTLLVAVGLCVGSMSAWADNDPIYSWVGGDPSAIETGGTASGTLNVKHSTVAGDLYAMTIAGRSTDLSTGGVTITLNSALQEGDVIKVTGFQDKNASDKMTALYMSFDQDDTNKGNISDTENWVNLNTTDGCATGTVPDQKNYTVTAALSGSNKITLIRTNGYTGTNLFISKLQIVRPVVNAKFTFTDATISNKSITGEVGTMSWTNQWTPNPSIDNNMFRVGNMSDGVVNLVGDAAGAKDLVTISFDMGYVGLSGKYAEFKVTDKNGLILVDESVNKYDGNFEKNTFGFDAGDFVSKNSNNPGMTNDIKNTFTLTFDYATKKMTGKVVNMSGTKSYTVDMPDGAGAVNSFAVRSGYNNEARRCYFDNLLITTTPGDYSVVDVDYTVKFVDEGGTEIKESITRSGAPGTSISSTTGDKESFWTSTKKYYYKSDDAEGKTIEEDGSTILTITYREASTFNYTVKSSLGTTISESSTTEGESVTVPYPTFLLSEGKLYSAGAIDEGGKKYSKTFTVSANNQEETITYSENKSNVVFYSEGEAVTGITSTTISNAGVRASMCAAGYNGTGGDVVVTTLSEVGTYKITISTYGSKGSYTFAFKAGDLRVVTAEYPGTNGPTYSGVFPIVGSTDIVWPATDANHAIDYIYIEKLSENATITTAAIPTSTYGTIASAYALDCANLPSGLEAYKVTSTTTTAVVIEQVTTAVAANTGLILKGTAGETYDIPVVASGTDISATNKLQAAVTATDIDADKAYILQGGLFHLVNAASTVPAGKAYLLASDVPSTAPALMFVFADDMQTTGINAVKGEGFMVNGYYDLQGRKVANPTKGLYIMNGKKVMVK